jgi:PKD repeat protein
LPHNTYSFRIDTTKPSTGCSTSGEQGLGDFYLSDVTVTLSPSDTGSGVAETWYSLESENWNLYTIPFDVSLKGETKVRYYSIDQAGNVESTKVEVVKIDKTPPETELDYVQIPGMGSEVTLTPIESTSGVDFTMYSLDGLSWEVYTTPFILTSGGTVDVYYYSVDLAGNCEIEKTGSVIINRAPEADAGGPYISDEGASITFDASTSTDIDGDLLQFRWDFDNDFVWDTEWSTDPFVTHTWNDDYSGLITVEVTDGGFFVTDFTTVTVNNVAPSVDIGADLETVEGYTITFTSTVIDPGSDTLNYEWDFGDGSPVSAVPSHQYADNGVYTVTLTVIDDDDDCGTDTLRVTVNNAAPIVNVWGTQVVGEGGTASFIGHFLDPGQQDTHTVVWNFGDGSDPVEGTLTPKHTYGDNGVYQVSFTVTDDDGASSMDTITVTVLNVAPTVDVGIDKTAYEGDTVFFTGTYTDPGWLDTHTIVWYFGDGSDPVEGTFTPDHVYGDNGVYTVTLTVTDDDGASSMDTITVTVQNVAPTVDAGADRTANEGDTVVFAGNYYDPGQMDTHTIVWDFGDGSDPVEGTLTPEHVYADNGVYTITLTVTDDDEGMSSDTLAVTVLNVAPTAIAGPDQLTLEGDTVSFSGSTTDPSPVDTHTFVWDFGDGSIGYGMTPIHVFADDGVYTVTLTVTDDDGGVGTDTLTVTATNVAPILLTWGDTEVDEGSTYTLYLTSHDPGDDYIFEWTIYWGDGTVEVVPGNPTFVTHTYADGPNVHFISATASDEDGTYVANNFGFETGDLTGWNVGPISLGGSVQVLQSFPLLKESYYPKEGSYFACLGTSYEGTSMSLEKIMHLGAGQSISGWAAFVARTCNTYAVVQILDEFGSVIATPWYAELDRS